jgi:DNA polymerase III subunit delta'
MDSSSLISLHKPTWDRLLGRLDRLPHALLIHGMPGVGKLELAERFAQLLLCEKRGPAHVPCGGCEACRWFLADDHPDVRFLEPEAFAKHRIFGKDPEKEEDRKPSLQIRIEQARALADFLNLASYRGGRRIAIVCPAEDMNEATANSLLKGLEEPPAGAMFLLVSHRPAALLPTIRSRCVPVPVPLPETAAAVAWLEKQGVRDAARWLAFAGGAPLRALEYASGERGAAIERALRLVASRDQASFAALDGREDIEPLVEVLQKIALDRAFAALTGQAKYSPGLKGSRREEARAWLAYARAMGQRRALMRHPLNSKLQAADMFSGMPPAA